MLATTFVEKVNGHRDSQNVFIATLHALSTVAARSCWLSDIVHPALRTPLYPPFPWKAVDRLGDSPDECRGPASDTVAPHAARFFHPLRAPHATRGRYVHRASGAALFLTHTPALVRFSGARVPCSAPLVYVVLRPLLFGPGTTRPVG